MGFSLTLLVERYNLLIAEGNRTIAIVSTFILDTYGHKVRLNPLKENLLNLRIMLITSRERPQNKPLLLYADNPDEDVDSVATRGSVSLNEKYVVRALPDGFHILCFEDSLQFPKESGTFFDNGSVEVINVQAVAHTS